MSRVALACVLAGFVLAGPALAATATSREQKHSGVIAAVAPDAHAITLDELGPATGPEAKPVRRTFELTNSTTIELDARSADSGAAGGWPGGFRASPLRATELHPGDFATVTIEPSHGEPIAGSIAVVRPPTATAAR